MTVRCYLHDQPGACDGRIDRAHWVPKRIIRRQFAYGAMRNEAGQIRPQARIEDFVGGGELWRECPVDDVIWQERIWSPICRQHHLMLDNGLLMVPRRLVPVSAIDFCDEYGLMWLFDRMYPLPSEVAV